MALVTKHTQVERSTSAVSYALIGEHAALLSVIMHLLPGVLTGALIFALGPVIMAIGYPPHVALLLAVPLVMIPVELGLLLYMGYKRNGRISLRGVVLYTERMPPWKYLVYVPLVFAASLTVFAIGSIVLDEPLRGMLFAWMPSLDWGFGGGYTRTVLIVTFSLQALFVTLGESTVEELYFRGFLLPRMGYAGRWATPLHSFLFGLYHVWQPWRLVSVAIGMMPLVLAVRRSRNIYLGMIVHMLLNLWDLMAGVAFILAMTSG